MSATFARETPRSSRRSKGFGRTRAPVASDEACGQMLLSALADTLCPLPGALVQCC
jgi:hypothetical protein